jgi:CxxC motif-containing protein (DUF1111 family)
MSIRIRSNGRNLFLSLLPVFLLLAVLTASSDVGPEAAAGFDTLTNGAVDQATHDSDRGQFEEPVAPADGLGPLYNATACVDCHQTPVTGGSSQVSEMRAGHLEHGVFVNPEGGSSLIHDRATDRLIQQRIPASEDVRTLRMSTSILGLGYVEAIDDQTLLDLAKQQAKMTEGRVHGQAIMVPVLEAPGVTRVGRFGWKDQHASLLSFSSDADLNEKGVTNRFLPDENLYFGRSVAAFNQDATEPNDTEGDIDFYASFMRATKAPPRGAITPEVQSGAEIFHRIGCDVCHSSTLQTAAAGTSLNGGTFVVPPALGGKVIHPFSDFLLHDIGTGDGIVQNGGPDSRNKMRTAPLWGLRTRGRLLHDGSAFDLTTAIRRHDEEARFSRERFRRLERGDVRSLLEFLNSL